MYLFMAVYVVHACNEYNSQHSVSLLFSVLYNENHTLVLWKYSMEHSTSTDGYSLVDVLIKHASMSKLQICIL